MKSAIRFFLAMLFLLLLSVPLPAQDESKTSQIIDELSRKVQNVDSYTVDTEIVTKAMGEEIKTVGTMAFKKPDLMHMTTTTEMMGGMKQEIYKSGDVIWTYMPLMKMATKVDLKQVNAALPGQQDMGGEDLTQMLKGFPKDAVKFIEKRSVDGKDVYAFQLSPDRLQQQMPSEGMPVSPQKMEFLVNGDNGLPYKVLMYGKDGSLIMEQTYSNYQLDVSIPDSEFEFTPPEGAQVMDMTEATINMMKQMKGDVEKGDAENKEAAPAE